MSKFVLTDKARQVFGGAIRFINDSITTDAGETMFLVKELNHLRNIIKEVKYNNLMARKIFPVVSGMGAGYKSVSYPVYDGAGEAEIIEGSGDFPLVNENRREVTELVKNLGIAYAVNQFELESALRANLPLETRKLMRALKGMEEKLDKIAFFGDSAGGLKGLFSNPSDLKIETITADGTGSSKKWKDKTFDKVERDIMQLIEALPEQHENDDLIMITTPAVKTRLTTLRISNTGMNLLEYIKNNSNIRDVVSSSKLKTVSTMSAKDVTVLMPMASPNTEPVCELVIPRDKEIRNPIQIGRDLVTDIVLDCSGLHIYYPKAIVVTDES